MQATSTQRRHFAILLSLPKTKERGQHQGSLRRCAQASPRAHFQVCIHIRRLVLTYVFSQRCLDPPLFAGNACTKRLTNMFDSPFVGISPSADRGVDLGDGRHPNLNGHNVNRTAFEEEGANPISGLQAAFGLPDNGETLRSLKRPSETCKPHDPVFVVVEGYVLSSKYLLNLHE